MEVTKSNFRDALPVVQQAVEECDFLAIDTELTGLHLEQKAHAFDTMEERYTKMCETAKDFLVIQVGLSCFRYYEDSKKYTHKDFNFYVFPRQHCSHVPDTFFTCSASSLNFLTSNDFDFNKLFREGIPFLTPVQEAQVRTKIEALHEEKAGLLSKTIEEEKSKKNITNTSAIHIPDEHKDFIQDIHQKVETYVSSESKERLSLPPCSPYRRKLIYQTVLAKYPTGLSLSTATKVGKPAFITVDKMSNSDKIAELKKKHTSDMNELDDAVGFRKVLDIISQSKKLLLGHNMLLDIFHIINQFLHPVPETLLEFKEVVKCIFPRIADTKTFASSSFKGLGLSTALFELQGEMESRGFPAPSIESDETHSCYQLDCGKMHEAGYDAFMTGVVFIRLSMKLAEDNKLDRIDTSHRLLSPYVNRPYIMRHFDIQSLNLNGPDPEGNRDNVFHVAFPKEWRTVDLIELFSQFGDIHVCWIDDVSAFAALKCPEQSFNVKKTLLKNPSTIYRVQPYSKYQEQYSAQKNNQTAGFADFEVGSKKRRTNSGGSIDGLGHNRSITPILEEEEDVGNNGTDKQDNCVSTSHDDPNKESSEKQRSSDSPKPKRKKIAAEDAGNHEISSTGKMFEEPDTW